MKNKKEKKTGAGSGNAPGIPLFRPSRPSPGKKPKGRPGAAPKPQRPGRRRKRGRRRSLGNQANYVITQSLRIGCSKRGDRISGADTELGVYSNASASRMREFANALTGFISERHPEVGRLDEIRAGHVQEYVDEAGAGWSAATRAEYASRLRKLWAMAENVFGVKMDPLAGLDFRKGAPAGEGRPRGGPGMSPEHWEALNGRMMASASLARWIPFMTRSTGTRIEEACSIEPGDVDLENAELTLRNCKNGRRRTVPIPDGDLETWRGIVRLAEEAGHKTLCGGIRPGSASKAIRRAMKKAGISDFYPKEGNHAIRKLYARESYLRGIESGLSPIDSWIRVQSDLGHGRRFRRPLFDAYVGNGLSPGEPRPRQAGGG